jgi:hypothetical protein
MAGTKSTDGDGNDAGEPPGAEHGKAEPRPAAADERAERLAAALRANLGRRKAAARAAAAKDPPDDCGG